MRKRIPIGLVLINLLLSVILVRATTVFRPTGEPIRVVEVPESWGKPVSICRRPNSVTILFEEGHIIVVGHPTLIKKDFYYLVQIVYIQGR